jgi:cytochrome c oxidase cbb3-type subunit 3
MARLLALLLMSALGCSRGPSPVETASTPDAEVEASAPSAPSAQAKPPKPDAALDPVATAARGKVLYDKYCYFCHGPEGRGYTADEAPALANDDLLALATDDFLREAIVKGSPGTTMSSWAIARGGPLGYPDASAIVTYLRTWQKRPPEPAEVLSRTVSGNAVRGAPIYAAHCASCHGVKGSGGKYNALANPELLASATDGFLATTIERGRAGTPMNGFAG